MSIYVNVNAQDFSVYENDIRYDISNQLRYIGSDELETIEDIILNDTEKLVATDVKTIDKDLPPLHWHWSEITIENKASGKNKTSDWILEFNQLVTHIKIFTIDNTGEIEEHDTGLFIPAHKKTTHHTFRSSIGKIKISPLSQTRIIIGLYSERLSLEVVPDITIESYFNYTSRLTKQQRGNAFFLGFILFMALYNLMLFLINRDRAYFHYSIYLFAICLFALYKNGILADNFLNYIFTENPKYNYLGKYVGYIMLVSYLYFLRYFLDLKSLMPVWDKIFKYLIYLATPAVLTDVVLLLISNFSPAVSDIPAIIYAIAIVLSSIVFCFKLYHTKSVRGYFIVAGLAAMSAGLLGIVVFRIITVEFTLTAFKYGSLIEVLLFSLGLAYRQREFEQEKQASELALEKAQFLQEQKEKETERLKEIDELKTKFFSNISHEFRTPLSVIISMAENITNIKVKSLIERNANNLLRLINQVLDLSKIEHNKESINYIKSDIIKYINFITESFYSNARSKGVKLEFISTLNKLEIYYDEQKIQQILYNLISNALKFSEENDIVTIEIEENVKNSELKISIADTGIGISKDDLPFVFDRYYRVESKDKKQFESTGIGLSLTKELIHLLDGNIAISSEIGVGTQIKVTLPIITNLESEETSLYDPNRKIDPTQESAQVNSKSETNQNIVLIVEDNDELSEYIKSILSDDFICYVVNNGQAGIESALKIIPDIIISDVMMPQKDGYELVDKLKKNKFTSHIPIILLTAKAGFDSKIQGLQSGADAYMTKPFSKKELIIRVSNMIALIKNRQVKFSILDSDANTNVPQPVKASDILITELKNYILNNIKDENLSVIHFCNHLNLSKSQLFRKIKATTGSTPGKLLREIRMHEAHKLVSQTDKTIKEVAFSVGFNDPGYFSKVYKSHFGESPSRG